MDVDKIPATTEAGSVRRRKTRACDRCHRNACRCSPGIMGTTCRRCEKQAVQCTYNRPVKRRGPPVRRARQATDTEPSKPVDGQTNIPPTAAEPSMVALSEPSVASRSPESNDDAILPSPASSDLYAGYEDFLNHEVIEALLQVFYHNIYPMVPYFHWPTFFDRVHHQMYRSDWGTFIATMSICALTIGQLDRGIPVPPGLHFLQSQATTLSSQCYTIAVKAMPSDISSATDYCEAMKASAILASVCLKNEDMKKTVAHLGDYLSLSVMHGFYSEANWPLGLSEIEKEERRRLFWGVYQQEQYISTNFGLPSRQCEAKTTVLYPAEVFDDEDITAMGTRTNPDRVSFLRGWNYCTDLYRLSENINSMMRAWQLASREEPAGLLNSFLSGGRASKHFTFEILNLIAKLHEELPRELKKVTDIAGNPHADWYGLIAMNVILTTSNIKMHLVGSEKPNVHLRCAIASELLDELESISPSFSNASSPIWLHHLAHIGHSISSALPSSSSTRTYFLVQNILQALAEFLENVELSRLSHPRIAAKLRAQVGQIDQCRQQASEQDPQRRLSGQSFPLEALKTCGPSYHNPLNVTSDGHGQEEADFSGVTNMDLHSGMQTSRPDIDFPPISSTSHSTDLFENWPMLPGNTDDMDPVGAFLSLGQVTQDS